MTLATIDLRNDRHHKQAEAALCSDQYREHNKKFCIRMFADGSCSTHWAASVELGTSENLFPSYS